jgi:hypothetical protein
MLQYLIELEHFSFTDENGQDTFVKVNSFSRVPEQTAYCGSIVQLVTSHGNFSLDDEHLFHNGKEISVIGKHLGLLGVVEF